MLFCNKNILFSLYFVFIVLMSYALFKWPFFSIIYENVDKDEVKSVFKRNIEELCILIWWKKYLTLWQIYSYKQDYFILIEARTHWLHDNVKLHGWVLKQARTIRRGKGGGAWSPNLSHSKYFFINLCIK